MGIAKQDEAVNKAQTAVSNVQDVVKEIHDQSLAWSEVRERIGAMDRVR